MVRDKAHLRIAYVIQNIAFDLASDVGIPITVKYTLRGLRKLGHSVSLLQLRSGRLVTGIDDISNPGALWHAPLGWTATRPFKLIESGARRLQRELGGTSRSWYAYPFSTRSQLKSTGCVQNELGTRDKPVDRACSQWLRKPMVSFGPENRYFTGEFCLQSRDLTMSSTGFEHTHK